MIDELVLADFTHVYYKIIVGEEILEHKTFRDPKDALMEAIIHNGKVVKMTKRMKETLEMQKI